MTSRGKSAVRGFETEIEKSREEANWKKAVELALHLKARSPQHESLSHFLIGEGKLEAFLDEWPPSKDNIDRAQRELSEARGFLTLATDEAGKKAGVALDAHLLLGKLHYACGEYEEALKHFRLAELDTLTEKELPIRSLRIVAESFAIKGLCLEQTTAPASSRYKLAERDSEMMRSFELASSLSLLYMQRTGGAAGSTNSAGTTLAAGGRAGPVLETALQRVPILHIRAARLHQAIDRYRDMLMAVEAAGTHGLRLTLARQLAEVLLRGVTGQVYKAPTVSSSGHANNDGPWKPKKYSSINQFVPQNEYEEVLLVLLVGEAMAVRDAVLSQAGEFATARDHALANAVALVDLLALAAARWGQLCLVLESLERAMKFSFGCAHIWRQRALATAAAAPPPPSLANHPPPLLHNEFEPCEVCGNEEERRNLFRRVLFDDRIPEVLFDGSSANPSCVRAMAVARRALALCPDDAPARLVAANTCYSCGWLDEGITLAAQALRIEEEGDGELEARACLFVGIGYQMKAERTHDRIARDAANAACVTHLTRAAQLDSDDHLALYHLALQRTRDGDLNEAMDACRACLNARPECAGGLRLAAALWSCACAGRRGGRALAAARLAQHYYPRAAWPRAALAALQVLWESGEAALSTGKELLQLLTDEESECELNGYMELDALSDSQKDAASHRVAFDAASTAAESAVGAWRGRSAPTSDSASDRSPRRDHRHHQNHHKAHAWLTLADLCLKLGRVSAAAGCVSEAAALTPFSHLVLYTRGMVHAASSEWEEARTCFQNALAVHPTHLDTMVQLGAAYYQLGWLRLAEKSLRDAATLSPRRADTWRRLALVLHALGEPAAAADAAAAALLLQPATPLLALPAAL